MLSLQQALQGLSPAARLGIAGLIIAILLAILIDHDLATNLTSILRVIPLVVYTPIHIHPVAKPEEPQVAQTAKQS